MKVSSPNRRAREPASARWTGLLLAMLIAASAVSVAQTPTEEEFDLVAQLVSAPVPIVLGDENRITGFVKNEGQTPVEAEISFRATNKEGVDEDLPAVADRTIPGRSQISVDVEWDGTYWDTSQEKRLPLLGPMEIHLHVEAKSSLQTDPEPANNDLSIERDLRIYDFELTLPQPTGTVGADPDDPPWSAQSKVKNTGNGPDVAVLSLREGTPGWTFAIDGDNKITLPEPGSERTFFVSAKPPDTSPADSVGTVVVRAQSEDASHAFVEETLTTPPVESSGALVVSIDPQAVSKPVGTVGTFIASVANAQNVEDSVKIQVVRLTGDPALLPEHTTDAVSIPSGESADFIVDVPVPADVEAGTTTWRVHAFSINPDGEEADAPDPFELTVEPWYGVDAAAVEPPDNLEPGATTPVNLDVTNKGNAEDTLEVDAAQAPAGWTFGDVEATLDAFSDTVVSVPVTVPADSPPGHQAVTLRVQSTSDAAAFEDVSMGFQVPTRSVPVVDTSLPNQPIEPGETIEFPVEVHNAGNAEDTFSLDLVLGSGSEPAAEEWTVTMEPDEVDVGPGDTAIATIEVTAPVELTADHAGLDLVITARNSLGGSDDQASLELGASPAFPDLVGSILGTEPEIVYVGQDAEILVEITNAGTADAAASTARIEVRDSSSLELIATEEVDVAALPWNPAEDATVSHALALATDATEVQVVLTVDVDEAVAEHDEANNQAAATLNFRTFDVDLVVPPDELAEPGLAMSFEGSGGFRATNVADNPIDMVLSVSSDPPWVSESEEFDELAPDDEVGLDLNFLIPEEPTAEEATLTLRAQLADTPGVAQTKTMKIRVPDEIKPTIGELVADRNVTAAGFPLGFNVTAADALGIHSVKLVAVDPSGTVTSRAMEKAPSGNYTTRMAFTDPGTYRLHVHVQDKATARNSNSTQAEPILVKVRAPAPPTLSIAAPEPGTVIRPGTPILVNAASLVPLQLAEYVVEGAKFPIQASNPLQVPTTGWLDGRTSVTVRVEDVFGQEANLSAEYVVDGSPPRIQAISFKTVPEQPGQSVVVSASVADLSGVASVKLRLAVNGAPAKESPMVPVGNGTYEVEIEWPDSVQSLAVVAEDTVGNRGLAERSAAALTDFEAGSDGADAPGLPLLAMLGTLAAVAAYACRIRRKGGGF